MAKRPVNSRWSEGRAPEIRNIPSEFEQVTTRPRLRPDQYTDSADRTAQPIPGTPFSSYLLLSSRRVGPVWATLAHGSRALMLLKSILSDTIECDCGDGTF